MVSQNDVTVGNIILLGTSHISPTSLAEVEALITQKKPQIVALELDRGRYHALLKDKKPDPSLKAMFAVGVKGYLFGLLAAWAERKLGEYTGMKPGSEMKHAGLLAKKNMLQIALIDQEIELTLRQLSAAFGWKEKWNFLKDILTGIFGKRKSLPFDLRDVPDAATIKELVAYLKKRYPRIYQVLITRRNKVMATNLLRLQKEYPDKIILAVVGAGHVDGMVRLLKN